MKISIFWIAFTNVDDENKQMNARPTVIIFIYVGSARARASEGRGRERERKVIDCMKDTRQWRGGTSESNARSSLAYPS